LIIRTEEVKDDRGEDEDELSLSTESLQERVRSLESQRSTQTDSLSQDERLERRNKNKKPPTGNSRRFFVFFDGIYEEARSVFE
jgi:hypothetical protein